MKLSASIPLMAESDSISTLPDSELLAQQIAAVRTVGFGQAPRRDQRIDELEAIATELSDDPTLPSLSQVADALKKAITRMGPYAMGRLAGLEFGLDDATEGMNYLNQRQEAACRELGISMDTLEARGKAMLRVMAEDLLARVEAKRSRPPLDSGSTPKVRRPRTELERLAFSALKLQYAGLNCAFLADFNSEVTAVEEMPHDWAAWEECSFAMFNAYIHFLEAFGLNTVYEGWGACRANLAKTLAEPDMQSLEFLVFTVACCPPPPNTRQHLDYYLWVHNHQLRGRVQEHFEESWLEWFHANLQHDTGFCGIEERSFVDPPGVDVLTAKTVALSQVLLPHLSANSTVAGDAQAEGLKAAATYYPFEDSQAIFGGVTLRQQVANFYATQSARLAKSTLPCYDNKEWYEQEPLSEDRYESRNPVGGPEDNEDVE